MRLPNRKPGKYTFAQFDPHMTAETLQQLQTKLERLKKVTLPKAIHDTQQAGENGDFSENAEYQIAKGRLRGINRTIDELQYRINHAVIITPTTQTDTIHIGHTVNVIVTTPTGEKSQTFQILGSSESNPKAGIISFQSPLGAALLGHRVGDTVSVPVRGQAVYYKICKIFKYSS